MEHARDRITKNESLRSRLLWFGVLAGPFAWSVQMFVNYNMGESFLCAPAMRDQGELFGLSLGWWLTLFNIILLSVAVAGLVVSFSCWKRWRSERGSGTTDQRAGWMAVAGLMTSVAFVFIVAVGFAPPFFLQGCEVSL